jgi:EmrB/QacA subfamily drug resistance transporter
MSTASAAHNGPRPGQPAGQTAAQAPGELTHRQVMLILTGLMAGMFLAALDLNIVATAIRTISDDLRGLSLQAWATTAYLITSTITTPLYGKLSDIYGRRPYFLTAISLFVVGSALAGMATSMYQLAAFRAIQGLGAGGLFSLALAIIGDIVPPRERARYQGFFLAVFGTASVLGPVIGGFLAGQSELLGITGWRWVFLINVPIGIVALIVVARTLHIPHTRRDHQIDFAGAAALIVALVPLLIVAEQGRIWGWTSEKSWLCYGLGALGIVWFLFAEFRAGDEALLPMRLFRGRTFSIGSALNFIIGMGMFGGIAALPLYLQIVKGKSPTEAGLLLLPLTIGIMAGSIISGQTISRTGRYKVFPITGAFLLLAGMLLMSRLHVDTSIFEIQVYSLIFGLGLGFNMQPLVLAVQNAVPPQDMGVATSSATFFRQMGGTLGTAVFLSVLFSTVVDRIRNAFVEAAATPAFQQALHDPAVASDPANRPVLSALRSGGQAAAGGGSLNDSSFINQLDPRLARPFLVGFASSIDTVFLCAAGVLAIALVVVFFLPEERLREHSGLQARMADEAAQAAAAAAPGPAPGQALEGAAEDGEPVLVAGRLSDGQADGQRDGRHKHVAERPDPALDGHANGHENGHADGRADSHAHGHPRHRKDGSPDGQEALPTRPSGSRG